MFHQTVGQPYPERLIARDASPSQDQIQSVAVPDQSRKANGSKINQRYSKAPAKHTEHSIARGHPQVAPASQLQASRNGVTLHRRDHWLR
jgi:hypothetical protein